MNFTPEQKTLLNAKLDKGAVKQRSQAGRSLSYIEGWHALAEANRIFGHDGWSRETLDLKMVAEHARKIGKGAYEKDGWGVTYTARVRVTAGGVTRDGTGAGHGIDADLGSAHESAIKEAETDATKRALMTFGWPFGLALYDKDQEHVENGNGGDAKSPRTPSSATYSGAPVVDSKTAGADADKKELVDRYKAIMAALRNAANERAITDILTLNDKVIAQIREHSADAAERINLLAEERKGILAANVLV